jgi:prepilin-type processing-associated H-X9-DG protein
MAVAAQDPRRGQTMRRILGTIGATLAVVAALATTATAQDRDEARTAYATVTWIMGDWVDDWFEDYEEGDQRDENMLEGTSRSASAGWHFQILPYIEQENLFRSGGEVLTSFGSAHTEGANFTYGDGSVRFIAQGIAPQTWTAADSHNGGEVLGSDW